jgi:hypothetical protein
VKIVVELPEIEPGRASSYTVANYVRAVLKVQALRQELGHALLEVERWKKALKSRVQSGILLAEADALLKELGTKREATVDNSGS